MRQIGAFEAKNHFSALLAEVAQGQEVTITLRGRPVARLLPMDNGTNSDTARGAAQRLLKRGKTLQLGGLTIRELIGEGRR